MRSECLPRNFYYLEMLPFLSASLRNPFYSKRPAMLLRASSWSIFLFGKISRFGLVLSRGLRISVWHQNSGCRDVKFRNSLAEIGGNFDHLSVLTSKCPRRGGNNFHQAVRTYNQFIGASYNINLPLRYPIPKLLLIVSVAVRFPFVVEQRLLLFQ